MKKWLVTFQLEAPDLFTAENLKETVRFYFTGAGFTSSTVDVVQQDEADDVGGHDEVDEHVDLPLTGVDNGPLVEEKTCMFCNGTGYVPGPLTAPIICAACIGTGKLVEDHNGGTDRPPVDYDAERAEHHRDDNAEYRRQKGGK